MKAERTGRLPGPFCFSASRVTSALPPDVRPATPPPYRTTADSSRTSVTITTTPATSSSSP